jgi:hypothetical protein
MFSRRQAGIAGRMSKAIVVMVLTSFCSGNMHSESHTPLGRQHGCWPLLTNEQSIALLCVGYTYMEIHSHAYACAYAHTRANARTHTYTQAHTHTHTHTHTQSEPLT